MMVTASSTAEAPFLAPEVAIALNRALQLLLEPAVNPAVIADPAFFNKRLEAILNGKAKSAKAMFTLGDIAKIKIAMAFKVMVEQYGYQRSAHCTEGVTAYFEKDGKRLTVYDSRPADGDRAALSDWHDALGKTGALVEAFHKKLWTWRHEYATLLRAFADYLEYDRVPDAAR